MNLYSLLNSNCIFPMLDVSSKKELINVLVNSLSNELDAELIETVRTSVFERENVMSTGVGKQLAIPHCKNSSVSKNYAAFALLKEPLDFDSIDGEPVKMVFLLVGPNTKNGDHIKLLSRISRLMNSNSFRDKVMQCTTKEEIYEAFKTEEEKYFLT